MKPVKLIAVFAENKHGQLARVTQILSQEGINVRWVNIASSEAFGVIKFLVDKTDLAFQSLRKHGLTASMIDTLAIEVEDQPGGLYAVAGCLADIGVNVDNASGFVANNRAVLLLEVHNAEQARQALEGKHLRLLSEEDVLSL
jgi:hypothetical protein